MPTVKEIVSSEEWAKKSALERAQARPDLFRLTLADNPNFASAFTAASPEERQRLKDGWQSKLESTFPEAFQTEGADIETLGDGKYGVNPAKVRVLDITSERVLAMAAPYAERGTGRLDEWQSDMKALSALPSEQRQAVAELALARYGQPISFKGEDGNEAFPQPTEFLPGMKDPGMAAKVLPTVTRVAPVLLASMTKNPRIVAGAAAAGDALAQMQEQGFGTREKFSINETALNAAFSMIPAATLGRFGNGLGGTAARMAVRSAEGAAQGAGFEALRGLADEGKVDLEATKRAGIVGAGLGVALEGVLRSFPKLAAKFIGKTPEQVLAEIPTIKESAPAAEAEALTALQQQIEAQAGVTPPPSAEASANRAADVSSALAQVDAANKSPQAAQAIRENLIRQDDFAKARIEQGATDAAATIEANRLSAPETISLLSSPDAPAPKVDDGTLPAATKLSPQAQRIYEEYGTVNPALVASLAGAGSGFALGTAQDGTPGERLERGLTYAVIGAGGGFVLGRRFGKFAQPAATPGSVLADVDHHLSKPTGPRLTERLAGIPGAVRSAIATKYAPLDTLAKQVEDTNGVTLLNRTPMSRRFEQLAGAPAKATEDLRQFKATVLEPLKGDYQNFDRLVFLKRTGQRLQWNFTTAAEKARVLTIPENQRTPQERSILASEQDKSVGDWTLDRVDAGLDELEKLLGAQRFADLDQLAAGPFQQELDKALRLQVESGRLSAESYRRIKASNDFYAPFRVLRTLDHAERGLIPNGIDTRKQITNAIEGISTEDFRLDSPLNVASEYIFNARLLAERNSKMQALAELADLGIAGVHIRRLQESQLALSAKETVNYFDHGQPLRLEVDPKVAESIKGLDTVHAKLVTDFVKRSFGAARGSLRFGATGANLGFQTVNLALADQPRLLLVSKYGLNFDDLASLGIRPAFDFVHSLFTAFVRSGDKANELYRAFQASGAAGSTIQEALSDYHLERATGVKGAVSELQRNTLGRIEDLAKAFEETTKLMGFKRGIRSEGITPAMILNNPQAVAQKMEEIVAEVRNYSGSPDFARQGALVEAANLNLLFMFFNARVQGTVSDFSRLLGGDGAKTAGLVWMRLAAGVGVPAALAWELNQRDEVNRADYEKRPEYEKANYFLLPRYNEKGAPAYVKNEDGEQVRLYWRIPKREVTKLVGNMVESGLTFAQTQDPSALSDFGMNVLENAAPINIDGRNVRERLESVVSSTNPLIKVPYEVISGRDSFRHQNTLRENQKHLSPRNQYNEDTPVAYRKMAEYVPQSLANPLGSPLVLQQIVDGATGGMLRQFEQKGATDFLGIRRRFTGSLRTDSSEDFEQINQMRTESADAKFEEGQRAQEIIRRARSGDKTALEELANPATLKAVHSALMEERDGLTSVDRAARSLPIQDGTRGRWLVQHLQATPESERSAELDRLIKARIVTREVLDSLRQRQGTPERN